MTTYRIRSMTGMIGATLCVIAFRAGAVEAQRPFEGVILAESFVNRQPQSETLYVKGNRWRLEGFDRASKSAGAMIGDDKGQISLLMPSRRVYMRQPVASDLDSALKLVTFTKVGRSELVAGSQCDYYKVQFQNSAAMDRQFCVATDIGFVGFTPEARVHEGLASLGIGAIARRKFPSGFVVLKALDKTGKVIFAATKIDRRALGDDLFEPPAGWREAPTGRPGSPR
jgi:hypothetical protein